MPTRHPIPRQWLMTDERMGEALWPALERLPKGAGVVFRHYATHDREVLFRRVLAVARRRRLVLVSGGGPLPGAHGTHNGHGMKGLHTRSAHNRRELVAAVRAGADGVFVSPVHATRSHPGARALGRVRLGLMIGGCRIPVIALGGMDETRFKPLERMGVHGWAGIDAWSR